jgi:hypothetical protein
MSRVPTLIVGALLMLVPAFAIAGTKVTSGDQSLQVTSSMTPAKAGKPIALHFSSDYESLNDGAQVKENPLAVRLKLPDGTQVHPGNRPQCLYSKLADKNTGGPSACPAGSQVGTGTATADARPTLPDPVPAKVTMFNGLDDVNVDGSPRNPPTPAVLFYAATNVGVNSTLPFDILGSSFELDSSAPSDSNPSLYHLQKVDVTFARTTKKPYITAPKTCSKTWDTSLTFTNYDGPPITASSSQKCHK